MSEEVMGLFDDFSAVIIFVHPEKSSFLGHKAKEKGKEKGKKKKKKV